MYNTIYMEYSSFLRRNWKVLLNIATFAALLILVVAIRDQFKETFDTLFKINGWMLLLMPLTQLLNYDAQTRLYRGLFRIVGHRLGYKQLFRTSLELNFVNNVFPSGGVTGISYLGLRFKRQGVAAPKAAVVQLLKLVMTFLSFEFLIAVGLFALAVQGHMSSIILLLASVITTVLIMVTAGFMFIIGSKRRIAGFFTYVTGLINAAIRLVRPRRTETINITRVRALFEELHENYMLVRNDWRQLKSPLVWSAMATWWEILTIYVVYMAFGEFVNIGAVILAYAIANFAGLISVLPGGVGVYEGLMTLTLSATGVPSRLSLPVTIMYRIVNTLIQLPPGYYFYHRHVNKRAATAPLDLPLREDT